MTINVPSTERLLQGRTRFASRELKWTKIDKLSAQSKGKGDRKNSSLLNFRKYEIFTYLHGPVLGHVPCSVDYRFGYCSYCDIPSVCFFSQQNHRSVHVLHCCVFCYSEVLHSRLLWEPGRRRLLWIWRYCLQYHYQIDF